MQREPRPVPSQYGLRVAVDLTLKDRRHPGSFKAEIKASDSGKE